MLFGLDGVEIGLIIVFLSLFGAIISGFPVAFAIGGAGIISFGIIAALDSAGVLVHQAIDTSSAAYQALVDGGVDADAVHGDEVRGAGGDGDLELGVDVADLAGEELPALSEVS